MTEAIYLDYVNLQTKPTTIHKYQLSSNLHVTEHHEKDDPSPFIYKNPNTKRKLELLITTIFPVKNTKPYKKIEPRETLAFLDHQLDYHLSLGGTLNAFVEAVRDTIEIFLYDNPEKKEHPANRYYKKWIDEKEDQMNAQPIEAEIEKENQKVIKIKKREGESVFTANQIAILAVYLRDKGVSLPEMPKTETAQLWAALTNRSSNTIYGKGNGLGMIDTERAKTRENLIALKLILSEILQDIEGTLSRK